MRSFHKPAEIDCQSFSGNNPKKKILTILEYSVLAPSTHNTQPWKFEIGESSCRVFIDNSRQLPAADPLKRDMYISLGALLKNIELVAKEFSVFKELKVSDNQHDLVADIFFKDLEKNGNKKKDGSGGYLDVIQSRTNYRGQFRRFKISEKTRKQIKITKQGLKAILVEDRSVVERLASLTAEGLKEAYSRPEFRKEISAWINPNTSLRKKGIPGYSLRMPLMVSHVIPKLIRFKDIGPKLARLNYKSFISASGVVVLAAEEENKGVWINVGQTAQEIFLSMEREGLACSIFVAAVETENLQSKINEIIGLGPLLKPQFLFCIGKPILPKVYSPRESVKSKMVS